MSAFHGKPPGGGAGGMSRHTERLRPAIALLSKQVAEARRLRRLGAEPEQIAVALGVATEEVEKALVQMRSPRPETTRGTLNVTLAGVVRLARLVAPWQPARDELLQPFSGFPLPGRGDLAGGMALSLL